MRVKAISLVACLVLCSSLALVLAPPLARPASANPVEVLSLNYVAETFQQGNTRTIPIQSGDVLPQFEVGKSNLEVGTNPYCHIDTVYRSSGKVTGALPDSRLAVEWQGVYATWDELLPFGAGLGYTVGKAVYTDGSGSMTGCWVMDAAYSPPSSGVIAVDGDAWVLFHTGTRDYTGHVMIGTGHATGTYVIGVGMTSQSASYSLRHYTASEVVLLPSFFPSDLAITDSGGGGVYELGDSYGPQITDEFLQFTALENHVVSKSNPANYLALGANTLTSPQDPSWSSVINYTLVEAVTDQTSKSLGFGQTYINDSRGRLAGVRVYDAQADWSSGPPAIASATGYEFFLMENASGYYEGKDYFGIDAEMYALSAGIETATGTGTATLVPSAGTMENLVAVSESSMPSQGKPDIDFPHGFFEFEITGLTPGQSVTLTITLPSAVPTGSQYWKYGPTSDIPSGEWYQIFMGDNDGDNVITITLTDGGLGDDDLTANGTIIDQGGPGWPPSGGGGGGSRGVPVFPSIYIGIGAALAAGILAYFVRRRMAAS